MKVEIKTEDIKKTVYFISNLTQMQNGKPMQGSLSSKGDLMGGIFDRWINIIPEAVLFDNIILPKLGVKKKLSVITDFYDYDPKDVGIAPDVIGIKYSNKAIPFVTFDNGWKPVKGCPQIEVKTFKQSQKMVSLRNQNYDEKYLVLAETQFRVDYLVPLIKESFYSDEIYSSLHMDDKVFIENNDKQLIKQARKVDTSNELIGTVDLLKITTAKSFMNIANKCGPKEGVEYFGEIEEYKGRNIRNSLGRLSAYGELQPSGLFRLGKNWYGIKDNKGKLIRDNSKYKTLDFYVESPDDIEVKKICKTSMTLNVLKPSVLFDKKLEKGVYSIKMTQMDRGAGEEYFILKSSISFLNDAEKQLLKEIRKVVEGN